ncbi:Uncharacterized protein HSRCO_2231 [Halanaeroarchaeum sp. HSR-CO]|uniref:HalOD1 output domain-containing protein n=1 Tax=Halanaeroarchaeum sp. HSR-CO TaxID=2866382 RepID=UPI00217D7416|nr:HalOD1 output domain-containing protein [Halanaeroarchaeum sp. HSR-CO]UWG48500.1 Uncharacterized protein HSRCO_2231 [Halanaeroarchaeum sp. HSR-CO]
MLHANSGIELTSMERDPASGEHRLRYDPETTPTSLAVVAATATVSNVETTDLDPLFESVDPDALDALTTSQDRETTGLRISFDYEGRTVTVDGHGWVRIGEQAPESTENHHAMVSD